MENTIEVRSLKKKFGDFIAVNSISFTVGRGEIFGFLGPNGAGKTTTIRMLCGLLDPSDGSGSVAGFDIKTKSEEIKKVIGYMSQRFSLYEDLTAAENFEFFSGVYDVKADAIIERRGELFELFKLGGKEDVLASELSGGFRQRLALACAIAHGPKVLFLDEPTAGVDPITRKTFWDHIYKLAEEGVTVLVTTHYMDEAEYCNRLALIYDGRIIAEGSPTDLKEQTKATSLEDFFVTLIDAEKKARASQ
jgi:ABC-2 type transport system ATP-binding protein